MKSWINKCIRHLLLRETGDDMEKIINTHIESSKKLKQKGERKNIKSTNI